MKKRTLSTAWIRTISTGMFAALFAVVLLTLVMPTQAKAVKETCDVHEWGEWQIVQQPTCTADGEEYRKCNNCVRNESRAIPAKGHTWGNWWTVQQPTCTENGMEQRSCHNCDTNEYRTLPATGHSWGRWRNAPPLATCTSEGRRVHTCSVCGTQGYDSVPALGHDWVTVSSTPGTCIAPARTVKQCSRCGQQDITEGAYGTHSWGAWQTTDATCIANGEKVRRCTVCADGVERETFPALGHNMVTVATHPATCMNRGYTELKCTRCDYTDTNEGTYGEHVMGEWQTTTQPTCTAAGEKRRTCTVCGKAPEQQTIPALGHNMVPGETVTGTCIREGYTSKKCSRCGHEEKTSTGYGAHVMGKWQTTTQPTCTAAGEKRRTCTVCGKAPEKESIPALGHDMVAGETVTGTCIREGYTSRKCSRCGHEEKTSTGYGAHVWGEWEISIPATCTTEGERRHTCTVCHVAGETLEYPALGHNMVPGENVTGTCIREGYTSKKCSRCGHEEKTSTGYGAHVMGEWQTTTQPTCTAAGEKQRNCTVCGKVPEKETIPANGHRWGAWYVKTPAEIDKDGLEERDCQVCGKAETRSIPALEGTTATNPTGKLKLELVSDLTGVTGSLGDKIKVYLVLTNVGVTDMWEPSSNTHTEHVRSINPNCPNDSIYYDSFGYPNFEPCDTSDVQYTISVTQADIDRGFIFRTINLYAYDWYYRDTGEVIIGGPSRVMEKGHSISEIMEYGDKKIYSNYVNIMIPVGNGEQERKLLVTKVSPDGFATTIGADIPVQYKVTNTGDEPITIETSYHQEDNGDVQAVNLLNGKVLQPGESAETAVFTHHVNGFFQVGSKNQRPDETWLFVYVTGKTQSGEAVRSSWVRFSYSKAEDGETEPKLVLSKVSPDGYPVHMNMKETYWNFSSTVSVDGIWSVTNVSSEPIKITLVENSYPWRGKYSASSGKAVDKTLLPGESYTSTDLGYNPYVTIMNPLTLMNNGGEYSTWVSWEATGVTESGEEVTSNTITFNWPVILDEDPEESTTEPKLVMTKISPDGYPVHISKKYTFANILSFATVENIWSLTNVSDEPIKITSTEYSHAWAGGAYSSGSIPMDKTLLPGESHTSKELGFNPKYSIINPWNLIENGGEYFTWDSYVATGITESGEEVTDSVTFSWPVILDEDPDDPTNDPTIDPEDPTHNPEDPNDPQNMAASLSVVKAEASAPANGQHYAAGEEITFSITYKNVGEKPVSSIHVYDALAGFGEIGSTGSLAPGESRPCSFKYRVTAADVNVYGYVANTAFATYQDGGLTRNAMSNRVVIILNPDIVPPGILDPENPDDPDDPSLVPIITIGDPDNPFDPEHPEEYEGPFGLPGMQGEDHCELIVKNHATGTTDFDQHYCAAHQSTRTAVQAMTGAAATPAVSLSAWTYARTLWQNDCNVLLEKLYSCANDPAKAIIMEEHIAFETMVTMREAALNVLYPDQPEKVAEEIAKLYEARCIELCYMLHTLPKAKPVEAASTEMLMMSGDGSICRTEFTGDTGADVFYTEALCSQHGMTDMMTGFVLNGMDDLATATKQIGQLWRSELRTEMDIIRGALSDENAAIITYDLGTTRIWLEAREALLQMLYPKQEAAVTNIINDTIKQRVTTLCEEVNK